MRSAQASAHPLARTDEVLMSNVLRLPAPAEAARSRFADPARADAPVPERLRFSPTAGAKKSRRGRVVGHAQPSVKRRSLVGFRQRCDGNGF